MRPSEDRLDELTSRPYQPGDENAIIGLYERALQRSLDANVWQWRYLDRPFGDPWIQLMWCEDRLVGHYALVPSPARLRGADVSCAMSLDTLTDADFRQRGIFARLAESAFDHARASGVMHVRGFPNANSVKGFVARLGWTLSGALPMLATVAPGAVAGDLAVTDVTVFDAEYDDLARRLAPQYPTISQRGSAYLRWRFSAKSGRMYNVVSVRSRDRLEGYICFKIHHDDSYGVVGDIVELLCDRDEGVFRSLVAEAEGRLREMGAARVNLWLNLSDPMTAWAMRCGYMITSDLTNVAFRSLAPDASENPATLWSEWFVQMSDSDVF